MANEVLLNDNEKVDQIKNWWKKYGNMAITAIVIILFAIVAWQFWNQHKLKQAEQASLAYENLLASEQNAPATTASLAEEIKQEFPSTPYADFAAFILAKHAIDQENYVGAINQLQWAIDHAASKNLEQLARIRLARVFMLQQQPDKAIAVLSAKKFDIYIGLANVVKGDAYKALGKFDQARSAYQTALQELPQQTLLWSLLNMKLNDLPVSN